ncbi:zinc-dependent alcohol dehydrogenase [Akkermansia glycaniphila]|nr:alcohol dehydrogenase catalytic domain-containing protein [Akkermansia glycaniphila]MBT9449073.1 alcohol dehydrogenase catalytic domain-containing protein [Akkermansia glycaniphila]
MIPATARVAMLTGPKSVEMRSYSIPEISDDQILVKVEACGICGTDGHEYNRDPFGLAPVVLGHEGTGEIVKLGKNWTEDTAGRPLKVGDKIVTCILPCGKCDPCKNMPGRVNMCENVGVYGLIPDDDVHFNGFFGEYIVIRPGSTVFNVSDLTLDQRILVEPSAVVVHSLERAKTTGLLNFSSVVLVQGCGPIGLLQIATLRTMGIENIIALDGNDSRLEMARSMGAMKGINFTKYDGIEAIAEAVKAANNGHLADFVFQCTGVGAAGANAWKLVKRGGGLCEVGFFMDGGQSVINHHYDICNKEITAVGSWLYTPQDYVITFDFLKRAYGIGLPLTDLISHRFSLDNIVDAFETNVQMKGIKVAVIVE